jgi:hypothetical protein
MQGQSWQPGEFPDAAGRAARRLNLDGPAGSPGASAAGRSAAPGEHVHTALNAVEVVDLVREALHLRGVAAGAAATAGGAALAVGVVGLAVGSVIHHYTEEAHQAHIDFGRSLGL